MAIPELLGGGNRPKGARDEGLLERERFPGQIDHRSHQSWPRLIGAGSERDIGYGGNVAMTMRLGTTDHRRPSAPLAAGLAKHLAAANNSCIRAPALR